MHPWALAKKRMSKPQVEGIEQRLGDLTARLERATLDLRVQVEVLKERVSESDRRRA